MTTATAPDLGPDNHQAGERPPLLGVPAQATPAQSDPWSLDPKQGRRVGFHPYDDPTPLVMAAIDGHSRDVHALLRSLERHRTPQARLKALVRELMSQRELAADYGCPLGSLCSELDKRTDGLDRTCSELLRLPVDWAEQQFRSIGRRDARDLAVALIASYQGIALLTNTFRDPELMTSEGRRLERWIDSLA